MVDSASSPLNRRTVLKVGVAAAGVVGGGIYAIERLPAADAATSRATAGTSVPGPASASGRPDIQFDVKNFIGPVRYYDEDGNEVPADQANPLQFQFGPINTKFVTFKLRKNQRAFEPTMAEHRDLAAALDRLEAVYPFSPSGVFVFVAYGLPYFNRLPRRLVDRHMPKLLADRARWALEEAQPAPTDFGQPGITKPRFQVPPTITEYDILMTLRSDSAAIIDDVVAWLRGSNRLKGQVVASPVFSKLLEADYTRSLMVAVPGQTRSWAAQNNLPYAQKIHPKSPMWMGFADQHRNAAGPAPIVTFTGNASAKVTDAAPGDYFDNGSVQHFSHVLLDLEEFYAEEYEERVGYMFRFTRHLADPYASPTRTTPPTVAGGPAYIENVFEGTGDAEENAKLGDMGHTAALQRSSRAADGTPMHIRLDGPGFDDLDTKLAGVPAAYKGKKLPKLQFSIFVPSAEFFRTMRRDGAAKDLVDKHKVDPADNGLEFFTTTTRRQNFLVPPRRHRSFPLVDLTRPVVDAWDSRLGRLLSTDGRLSLLQHVNDLLFGVLGGSTLTLSFEGGVPADATIRSVTLYVRHYESSGTKAGSLVWTVGTGAVRSPVVLGSTTPAVHAGRAQETRAEWDVSAIIRTPAQANTLTLSIENRSPLNGVSFLNNAYLVVDHD